jgi:hypothetical protein
VGAKHLERPVLVDGVACHQDSLRLFDDRPPTECSLEALVLGEALQRDVDRALQLLGVGIDDVGEDAAPRRLMDVGGISGREQRDHRAGRFVDDLRDQLESVL